VRRIALLVGVTVAVVATLLLVRDSRHRQQTGEPATRQEPARRPPPRTAPAAPLGIIWPDVTLARLDPRTLRPQGPVVELGEYHSAWSLAPDGDQLALAISSPGGEGIPVVGDRGRIGIRIIDTRRMAVVRDISTGVAAEALGWLRHAD
jgi:hypothetical protein